MFERRLKILLGIIFSLAAVMFARAVQLQVAQKPHWEEEATKSMQRPGTAETSRGVRIGPLEAKLARRLIKFMRGGNRYQAGVTSAEGNTVKLIVRETYQDPRFAGKPSFPMRRKREVEFRPYAKESLLAREVEVFTEDEEEGERLVEEPASDEMEEGMHAVEDEAETIDFSDEAESDAEDEDEDEG